MIPIERKRKRTTIMEAIDAIPIKFGRRSNQVLNNNNQCIKCNNWEAWINDPKLAINIKKMFVNDLCISCKYDQNMCLITKVD